MKKQISFFILALITFLNVSANDNITFHLVVPDMPKVTNSLYSSVLFLDDRPAFEFEAVSIDKVSFNSQLNSLMRKITDNTSQGGVLFFQLRHLRFDKDKKAHLRVSLYEKEGEDYYLIKTVDESMPVLKSKESGEIVSKAIAEIISRHLTSAYSDPKPYFLDELQNIAFFEKENLALYNTDTFEEGIYNTFSDFINQTPSERTIFPKFKDNELKEIRIINPLNDKERKVSPAQIYAVVLDGRPFIALEKKFVPLQKIEDDFYFEDESKNSRVGIAPSFAVGIGSGGYRGGGIGIGIMTHTQKIKILFRMDHLTGGLLPVSVVE